MAGETNLSVLLKEMDPFLNKGEYVFATLKDRNSIHRNDTICEFKEKEGTTVIIEKRKADTLNIKYEDVCAWITLNVNSALQAVGFTAKFSSELAKYNISCNVVAGYFHDHIFVSKKEAKKAIKILEDLSNQYN